MSVGIEVKKDGVIIEDLKDSLKPLTLNFLGGASVDVENAEIEIPIYEQAAIVSNPPVGAQKVTNLYIKDGKLTVEYEE